MNNSRRRRRSRRIRRIRRRIATVVIFLIAAIMVIVIKKNFFTGTDVKKIGDNWWYTQNGFIEHEYNGFASNKNGLWFIQNGKVNFNFNGIEKHKNDWFFIRNGKVDYSYTGIAKNQNGWWRIKNGKVDFNYNGLAENENGWWQIENGQVNMSYTGIAENEYGRWYVQNGQVDFSYNQPYFQNGTLYTLENGKVANETKMIAHRGLSSEAPDNTVKSFTLAGKAGFWGCETDIYLTKDNQFIVEHNDDFGESCGVKKTPGEMTVSEIKQLKITNGANYNQYKDDETAIRVPTLIEYLAVCKEYGMTPVIEIKEKAYSNSAGLKEHTELLYDTVKQVMGDQNVIFISMDFGKLRQMREVLNEHSDTTTVLQHVVYSASDDMIQTYKSLGMELDSAFTGITPDQITRYHDSNIKIGLWIVNDQNKLYDFAKSGINYITTNQKSW